jgi:DNA-binding NarL/FixJ family response regulator
MSALKVTQLQRAVLTYMARGYTPKQIAAALGMKTSGVCGARRRVMNRYGITNDTQLGMLIERSGFVSEDERERMEHRRAVVLKSRELQ